MSANPSLFLDQLPFQGAPLPVCRGKSSDCFVFALHLLGRHSYRGRSFGSAGEGGRFTNSALPADGSIPLKMGTHHSQQCPDEGAQFFCYI